MSAFALTGNIYGNEKFVFGQVNPVTVLVKRIISLTNLQNEILHFFELLIFLLIYCGYFNTKCRKLFPVTRTEVFIDIHYLVWEILSQLRRNV